MRAYLNVLKIFVKKKQKPEKKNRIFADIKTIKYQLFCSISKTKEFLLFHL